MEQWHALMPEPTVADALVDRLAQHRAWRITVPGESMQKRRLPGAVALMI